MLSVPNLNTCSGECSPSVMLGPQKGGSFQLYIDAENWNAHLLRALLWVQPLVLTAVTGVTWGASLLIPLNQALCLCSAPCRAVLQLWLATDSADPDLNWLIYFLAWPQACLVPNGLLVIWALGQPCLLSLLRSPLLIVLSILHGSDPDPWGQCLCLPCSLSSSALGSLLLKEQPAFAAP